MARRLTMVMAAVILTSVSLALMGCNSLHRVDHTPAPTIEGRWKGTWLSDTNGHTGALWCIVTRNDDGTLHARYRGTYGTGITFEYDVPMTVVVDGDTLRFSSEADLGVLAGGMYTYEGTVRGDVFHATYNSSNDNGTFDMTRLTGPVEETGE